MTSTHPISAVLYCRVSTKRQAKEGSGLQSQATRSTEYAVSRGYQVIETFNDDVSGKLARRPGFDSMIKFICKNRKKNIVVIIDDVSRMARDVRNHSDLKDMIYAAGALLECPSWNFATDPDSIFHENLMASLAQHQRQKNAEQATNRMRARMLGGYAVHNPPIGYRYEKHPAGGSTLVRDEPRATIIQQALEGFASGRLGSQGVGVRSVIGGLLALSALLAWTSAHNLMPRALARRRLNNSSIYLFRKTLRERCGGDANSANSANRSAA